MSLDNDTSTWQKNSDCIAVTGASGLIGRRLLPQLSQGHCPVKLLSRSASNGAPFDGKVQVIRGSLEDVGAVEQLVEGANTVVHLAGAAHSHLATEAEVARAFTTNVEGSRTLLKAARDAGVATFVFLSSAHVYSEQRGLELNESAPVSSSTPYAHMKLLAEAAAQEAASAAMRVVILRPCLTYGPGARHNLKSLMRALRRGYYVQQSGAQTLRSLASVDTVAAAILHVVQLEQAEGIYNVADRLPVALEAWVDELADRLKVRRPLRLPKTMLAGVASAGSAMARLHIPAPLTRDSLAKLTEPFTLSVERLAQSGFVWPDTQQAVLQQMIDAEFAVDTRLVR